MISAPARKAGFQGGVIQQVGSPLELYDDPANVFVAGFIGAPAMTFIEADVVAEDDGIALVRAGTRLVRLPPHAGAAPGGRAILGIRPEHVRLVGPLQRCLERLDSAPSGQVQLQVSLFFVLFSFCIIIFL
jgi:ABC-type sugar transport system ATPase subunit